MKWYDYITVGLGLGIVNSVAWEWLPKGINNMTLGIHGQEWEGQDNMTGEPMDVNELFIGLLFIRIIIECYNVPRA